MLFVVSLGCAYAFFAAEEYQRSVTSAAPSSLVAQAAPPMPGGSQGYETLGQQQGSSANARKRSRSFGSGSDTIEGRASAGGVSTIDGEQPPLIRYRGSGDGSGSSGYTRTGGAAEGIQLMSSSQSTTSSTSPSPEHLAAAANAVSTVSTVAATAATSADVGAVRALERSPTTPLLGAIPLQDGPTSGSTTTTDGGGCSQKLS